jgi:hypothetical protein
MIMTQFATNQTRSAQKPNWRLSVDDAWRSEALRQKFEAETGLSPLAVTARGVEEEAARGYTAKYHEKFIVWATRHLGLEDVAPSIVREKLAAR